MSSASRAIWISARYRSSATTGTSVPSLGETIREAGQGLDSLNSENSHLVEYSVGWSYSLFRKYLQYD